MLTIEMDNFDLGQICRSGQCFRMDQIGDDRYRVIAGDKYLELTQEKGIVNFFCPEEDFISFWIRYFDLDCDYQQYIERINPRDRYLTEAVKLGNGIRILQQDLWEMIITFLISQQNNITRIKRCIENISREFGEKKISSNGIEYYAFPTPQSLSQLLFASMTSTLFLLFFFADADNGGNHLFNTHIGSVHLNGVLCFL